MPKTFTTTDVRIDILQITVDANGNINGCRITYRFVDSSGKIIPEFNYKELVVDLTQGSLAAVLADANKLAVWATARIKTTEGI